MASTKKDTHITNLAALEKAANGEIVTLPGWTEEQPFVARLKRASLTQGASGNIGGLRVVSKAGGQRRGKGKDSRADGQRKDEQDALTEAIRGLAARRLLCAEGRAADGLEALAEADDGRGERHDRAGAQPHARQDGRAEFGGYA